ncbi:MAG TPA: hypothetical protein EYP86_05425 [Candidatus Altiarchaeales archaeon]|nr:hypothetical protein [Candidatus Altiarchaeales archaeon]
MFNRIKKLKDRDKIPLIAVTLVSIIIISFILIFFSMLTEEFPEPDNIVDKQGTLRYDTTLFKVYIVRYPVQGTIVPFTVENKTLKIGISADRDKLNFGVLPQTLSVRKFLNLKNREDSKARICVRTYGTIRDFVNITEDTFILEKEEYREVQLTFSGDRVGNYTGEIDVITKKMRYDFMEPLLPLTRC